MPASIFYRCAEITKIIYEKNGGLKDESINQKQYSKVEFKEELNAILCFTSQSTINVYYHFLKGKGFIQEIGNGDIVFSMGDAKKFFSKYSNTKTKDKKIKEMKEAKK